MNAAPANPRLYRLLIPLSGVSIAVAILCYCWLPSTLPSLEIPGADVATTDREIREAIETARQEVRARPQSGSTWGRLGKVLQVHNFRAQALVCYAEAERLDSHNAEWPYLRASIILVGADPLSSIPYLQRAAELGTPDELARLRLAEILIDSGRFDEADKELKLASAYHPNSLRLQVRLAQVAAERREWDRMFVHLARAGDTPFSRKLACWLRMEAFRGLNRTDELKLEQQNFAGVPDDAKWPDAILDRLSEMQVGASGRMRRAKQLMDQNDAAAAMRLLIRTVCDYPEFEGAWMAAGGVLAMIGEFEAAEQFLLKAVQLSPSIANTWISLGSVRKSSKNYEGAAECYSTAMRLTPNSGELHFLLGECLETLGRTAEARKEYQEALKLDPGHSAAKDRFKRLTDTP